VSFNDVNKYFFMFTNFLNRVEFNNVLKVEVCDLALPKRLREGDAQQAMPYKLQLADKKSLRLFHKHSYKHVDKFYSNERHNNSTKTIDQ
jgi:hypothetical protein